MKSNFEGQKIQSAPHILNPLTKRMRNLLPHSKITLRIHLWAALILEMSILISGLDFGGVHLHRGGTGLSNPGLVYGMGGSVNQCGEFTDSYFVAVWLWWWESFGTTFALWFSLVIFSLVYKVDMLLPCLVFTLKCISGLYLKRYSVLKLKKCSFCFHSVAGAKRGRLVRREWEPRDSVWLCREAAP